MSEQSLSNFPGPKQKEVAPLRWISSSISTPGVPSAGQSVGFWVFGRDYTRIM